jgi:hypothetical protein
MELKTGLSVETMGLDVVRDAGGEEVGTGIAGFEALAQVGGGDLFIQVLKKMDTGLLEGGKTECVEIAEREAGTARDDPFGELEEAVGLMPAGEIEKTVRAGEIEDVGVGHEQMQGGEGLNGVVGGAVGVGGVEVGYSETLVGDAGERKHGEPILVGSGRAVPLERLATYRSEEDAVQMEGIGRGSGDSEMTAVWGVEGSAKKGDSHGQFSPDGAEKLGRRFRLRGL